MSAADRRAEGQRTSKSVPRKRPLSPAETVTLTSVAPVKAETVAESPANTSSNAAAPRQPRYPEHWSSLQIALWEHQKLVAMKQARSRAFLAGAQLENGRRTLGTQTGLTLPLKLTVFLKLRFPRPPTQPPTSERSTPEAESWTPEIVSVTSLASVQDPQPSSSGARAPQPSSSPANVAFRTPFENAAQRSKRMNLSTEPLVIRTKSVQTQTGGRPQKLHRKVGTDDPPFQCEIGDPLCTADTPGLAKRAKKVAKCKCC